MKKHVILVFLLLICSLIHAQDNTHFHLSVSLGKGNQISKGQYDTAIEKQFYDDLHKQTAFDLSFGYYLQPQSSLGFEVFLDYSSGQASMAMAEGSLLNGSLAQCALGVLLNYRFVIDKNVFVIGLGVAYLAYEEQDYASGFNYELNTGARGTPAKIKYEYRLSNNFGLGVSATALLGAVTEYTETINGVSTTTTLDSGDAAGISRWSITVGPRFYF